MTAAQTEEGKEIFPDEEKIIHNKVDLERYLSEIDPGNSQVSSL